MLSFLSSQKFRARTGAYCVYRHFMPGASVPFYMGSGALSSGTPYDFGTLRGLGWLRRVHDAGHAPGDIIVDIVSLHDTAEEAIQACRGLLHDHQFTFARPASVKADPLTAAEIALIFGAKGCLLPEPAAAQGGHDHG